MIDNQAAWNAIADTHRSTIPLDFAPLLRSLSMNSSLLEIGSGYGRVLTYLRQSGWLNLTGLDISIRMALRASANDSQRSVVSSSIELPFARDTFCGVLAIGVFSSLSRREARAKTFTECARVLQPGGVLLVRDFVATFTPYRLLRYLYYRLRGLPWCDFVAEGIEFHHFRRGELERDVVASGLRVISVTRNRFVTMHGRTCHGVTVLASRET